MPISRLNYTGRRRIERADVAISITPDEPASFSARIDLSRYGLPADARVAIEADRREARMHFPYGTVASPCRQPGISYALSEFREPLGLLFNVRVTSSSGNGQILAIAENVPVVGQAEPDSLLPVRPVDELGQEVWHLDFEEDGPHLSINSRIGDWKSFANSDDFAFLVMPAVLREVLREIGRNEREDTWADAWLELAVAIGSEPAPVGEYIDGEWETWIEGVVQTFASKHRFADAARRKQSGGVRDE